MNIPGIYTLRQAAERLQLSEVEVDTLLQSGQLKAASICGKTRVTERDLDECLRLLGSCGLRVAQSRRIASTTSRVWGAVCAVLLAAVAFAVGTQADTITLLAQQTFELPIQNLPPLNSSVVWNRRNVRHAGTVELLSLLMENKATNSFPWPLYIQLTSSHDTGDAVGAYVRLRDSGKGWGAAFHTDLYHDGAGTSIGGNFEVSKSTENGRALGINIQSKGKATDEGINLQSDPGSHWKTGLHFDQGSKGDRAIWIEGDYGVGLDSGKNDMRMNAGSKLKLEESGQICLTYNAARKRIEFRDGEKVIGYLNRDSSEHGL